VKLRRVIFAATVAAAGFIVAPAVASAHHPDVSGVATCNSNGSWSVTWTATPWEDHPDLQWQITSPSGYAPGGWQTASAGSSFTRTVVVPASYASKSETVSAEWSNGGTGSRSATVARPSGCTLPCSQTPYCTPCSYDPSLPSTSADCNPCQYDPSLPASSPDCYEPCEWDPSVPAGSPECEEPEPCATNPQIPADDPYCFPEETTTTTSTTTTTLPGSTTTTTVPVTDPTTTTTTLSLSGGPTTTQVQSQSSTTIVASGGPTTTTAAQLPRTGGGNGSMSLIALVLLGVGAAIVMVTRRNQQA
jgi:LPXTG-motif cell wall-anchored protein